MAKLDQDDLDAIQSLIDVSLEEKLESKLDEKLDTKLLTLRSDIFDKIDSFAKEAEASRQERTVAAEHIKRNSKRIESLETKVFGRIPQ